jgi:hypothetical protein
MLNNLRIKNNQNLVKNILKYNNVKDLSHTSQVSRTFYSASNKFQTYWREQMNKRFSNDYEHYNIVDTQNLSEENEFNDSTNWKDMMKRACEIEQKFINPCKISLINYEIENDRKFNFLEDLEKSKREITSSMKDFIGVPVLRKGNPSVENDLNSTLQIFLMDNIFDSQDLDDYYDGYFSQETEMKLLDIRNPNLPFAKELENFQSIILESTSEKEFILSKIRYYNYQELIKLPFDNSQDVFSAMVNIVKFLHSFCEFSCNYIKKYKNDDLLFLNEYSKRYRHYVDAAIHLDRYFENFSVIINYLYDLITSTKYSPKFSILRMMIKMWNKEVLENIQSEGLIGKMEKIVGEMISQDFQNLSQKNVGNKQTLFSHNTQECLIEQMNQHLIDVSCNEFNSFYLNSSKFKLEDGIYQEWENRLIKIIEVNLSTIEKVPFNLVMEYLQNNQLLKGFITKTRTSVHEKITTFLGGNLRKEILSQFKTFNQTFTDLTLNKVEDHFRVFGDLVEEREDKILEVLINSQVLENKSIAKYKAIQFIKQSKNCKSEVYTNFQNFLEYIDDINCEREYSDSLLSKENSRMNIHQEMSEFESSMYSFTKQFEVKALPKKAHREILMEEEFSMKGFNLELDMFLSSITSEECLVSDCSK